MAGPWEDFQTPTAVQDESGPWIDFQEFKDTTPDQPFVAATPSQPIPPEQLTTYGGPPKQTDGGPLMVPRPTLPFLPPKQGEETGPMGVVSGESPLPFPTAPAIEETPVQDWENILLKSTVGGNALKKVLGDDVAVQVMREGFNQAKILPEFFTSPQGAAAMVATGASPLATTAYFTYDTIKGLVDQLENTVGNWPSMTAPQKARSVVQALGAGTIGAFLARGMAGLSARAIRKAAGKPLEKEAGTVETMFPEIVSAVKGVKSELKDLPVSIANEAVLPIERPTAPVFQRPTAPVFPRPAGEVEVARPTAPVFTSPEAPVFTSPEAPVFQRPAQPVPLPLPQGPPKGLGPYRMIEGVLRDANGKRVDTQGNILPEVTPSPVVETPEGVSLAPVGSAQTEKLDRQPVAEAAIDPVVEAEKANYRASVALEKAEQQKLPEDQIQPLRDEVVRTEKAAIAAEDAATPPVAEPVKPVEGKVGESFTPEVNKWVEYYSPVTLTKHKGLVTSIEGDMVSLINDDGAPVVQKKSNILREVEPLTKLRNGQEIQQPAPPKVETAGEGKTKANKSLTTTLNEQRKEDVSILTGDVGTSKGKQNTTERGVKGLGKTVPFKQSERIKLTELHEQWKTIKEKHPDELVLVRLGDFYEAFYGDAETLSKTAKIALTKRNEVPMSGVPYHAVGNYIKTLEDAGHKVYVVEDYRTEANKPAQPITQGVEAPVANQPVAALESRIESLTAENMVIGEQLRDIKEGNSGANKQFVDRLKNKQRDNKVQIKELEKQRALARANPITQGPGAKTKTTTTEAPESYSGTALKHAVDAVERAGWAMRDAPDHVRKNIAEAWIRTEGMLKADPKIGERLVDELIANPEGRGLNFDESALLLRQKLILTEQMNDAAGRTHTAKTAAEKSQATADFDSAHEKMLNMLDAIHKRGTAWGQEGRWRQVMAQEDYSLATLLINREKALGKKIDPGTPEYIELETRAKRLQELNDKLTARVAEVEAASASTEVKRAIREETESAKKEVPYHPKIIELAEGYAKELDAVGSKALTELRSMFEALENQMPQGPGARTYRAESGTRFDKNMLDRAAKYGASKIGRSISEFEAWKDSMVADIGPGFERYAKDVWVEANRQFNAFIDSKGKHQTITRKVKTALKGTELGTETILKRIATKAIKTEGGKLPDIKYQLRKLARHYIRQGIKEEGPLIDALHADVQKVLPDLTREDVRAIFAGYAADLRVLSKETTEVILRDLSGQNREIYKLDLLKRKIIPPKLQDRAIPSQKERMIRKQVEAEKRTGGFAPPDPEAQLRSALQTKETRLTNQILDMQKEIDTKQKIAKEKRDPSTNARIETLIAHRKALKEIHDEVFKKPDLTDAERLAIWKDRVKEQIEELRDRRARGDFQRKPKPDPIRFDKQALELEYLKKVEHEALMEMRLNDDLSKRNTPQIMLDSAASTARFVHMAMAGGEFSAVFKQGAAGAFGRPITTARNFKKSLDALWSKQAEFEIKHDILTREDAQDFRRHKLEFSDANGKLASMEEMIMFRTANWMKKIPLLKQYTQYMEGFQRAFSTFLNLMRADTFSAMKKEYGSDPATLDAIANYINVSTGRGSHATARFGGPGMNALMFAPRWSISRFQYLFAQPIIAAGKGNRRMIINQYARTLTGLSAVYALGYAAGADVDWDPRSSTFGKIKLAGRVIDPLFGLVPVIRLLAQEISGTRKNSKGQVRPVRDNFRLDVQGSQKRGPYEPSGAELIGRFAWSKLAPAPEAFVSASGGENVVGEKFNLGTKAIQMVSPITYRDILGAIKDQGVDEGTAIDILAFWGLSSYIPKEKKSNQTPW